MKNEIKYLRKCQKSLWDQQYPGYPYQLSVVIDLKEKAGYKDVGRKMPLDRLLKEVNNELIYQSLGANNTSKQTFIIDQHLEDHSKYLLAEYGDFFIDNLNAVRFYFALNSAIVHNQKGYIFAMIDEECECVDVKVFNNLEEIKKYYEGGFVEEE